MDCRAYLATVGTLSTLGMADCGGVDGDCPTTTDLVPTSTTSTGPSGPPAFELGSLDPPGQVMIGESFTLTATFENVAAVPPRPSVTKGRSRRMDWWNWGRRQTTSSREATDTPR